MANDVRAIASHWAPNSGAAADVNAMRESGLHTPVALDDRTYGGRSFAKIVTRSPLRCAVIAAVNPSAPQPITATSRLPVAASRAFFTAMSAAPHDSDHPLPPCPKLCTTTLLPTCSTSVLGPAARNGLRHTVVRKIRSTCARIGTIGPTAS
jgi:hypothetical protein